GADAAEHRQRGLERLLQALRQRDHARAALGAAASEVRLELEAAGLERVRVDGKPPGEAVRALRIVDPLTIEIAGVGRIVVRPVVAERRRLQSSLKEAERTIAREVQGLGLRRAKAEARQLEFALATEPAIAGRAAAPTSDDHAAGWPDAAAVASVLAEAERQVEGAVVQLRAARRELDLALEARHRTRAAHEQAIEHRARAQRRLEQLRTELSEAEGAVTEADLAGRIAQLHEQLAVAEAHARQLNEQAPAESVEELEQRIAELRRGME